MVSRTSYYFLAVILLVVAGCGAEPDPPSARDSVVLTDVPEIVTSLKSGNWQIRSLAANRLGMLGPAARDALPELERLKSEDPDKRVRVAAESAITRIEAPPTP